MSKKLTMQQERFADIIMETTIGVSDGWQTTYTWEEVLDLMEKAYDLCFTDSN